MSDIYVDRVGDIMVFRAVGTISYDELVDTIETCYPLVTRHILWDFRDCDLSGITSKQFMMLPALASSFTANRRKDGKSAYVGTDTANYGLLSTYEVIAEIQGKIYNYNIFMTLEAALKWLRSPQKVAPNAGYRAALQTL